MEQNPESESVSPVKKVARTKARFVDRNNEIHRRYAAGETMEQLRQAYGITRQRVMQILHAGTDWKPKERSTRVAFVGVNITSATKDKLKNKAKAAGLSVSQMASDALEELAKGTD